jgi:translation initiation factor 2A
MVNGLHMRQLPGEVGRYPFVPELIRSVQLLSTSSSSTTPAKTLAHANVISLSFSPLSTTLFTFERAVKSETEVYKNVRAWNVQSGEEAGGWYQKTQEGW